MNSPIRSLIPLPANSLRNRSALLLESESTTAITHGATALRRFESCPPTPLSSIVPISTSSVAPLALCVQSVSPVDATAASEPASTNSAAASSGWPFICPAAGAAACHKIPAKRRSYTPFASSTSTGPRDWRTTPSTILQVARSALCTTGSTSRANRLRVARLRSSSRARMTTSPAPSRSTRRRLRSSSVIPQRRRKASAEVASSRTVMASPEAVGSCCEGPPAATGVGRRSPTLARTACARVAKGWNDWSAAAMTDAAG